MSRNEFLLCSPMSGFLSRPQNTSMRWTGDPKSALGAREDMSETFLAVYVRWMQLKHLGSSLNCSSGPWKAAAYIKRRRREKQTNCLCSIEKNQTSKSSPDAATAACQEIKYLFLNSEAPVQTSGEPPIHKERLSVVRLWQIYAKSKD